MARDITSSMIREHQQLSVPVRVAIPRLAGEFKQWLQ